MAENQVVNIVLAGPCGVGKSEVGRFAADHMKLKHIDLDEVANINAGRAVEKPPCSKSFLDLKKCLPQIIDTNDKGFVLDFGGFTVFNRNADNENRLKQILWVKQNYFAKVIVLEAKKVILKSRFFSSGRNENGPDDFEDLWLEWKIFAEPYWEKCEDRTIDTSRLTVEEIVTQIETIL